jgi:hypothetical protein
VIFSPRRTNQTASTSRRRPGGRETTKATPKPSHSKITMRDLLDGLAEKQPGVLQ